MVKNSWKQLQLISILLLTCMFHFTPCAFSWTIAADFEQGVIGQKAQGSSGFNGAGSSTLFANEQANGGQKACKMTWPSGSDGFGITMGSFSYPTPLLTEGGELWARGYFYFKSPWSWNCSPVIKVFRAAHVQTAGGANVGYLSVFADSNGRIVLSNEAGDTQYATSASFSTDKWQCIEMYVRLARAGNGPVFRIWKDGVLIAADTTAATIRNATDTVDMSYIMSYWNGGAPQSQTQYLDDFVVTTNTPSQRDASGNPMIGLVNGNPVNPPATTDTTAPSKPNGLAASAASSTQINLSWTASTDTVGVTGYRVYRGGTQIGTSATTTYQNTGLSPSTAYSYTVAAYDAAGNVSAQSTAASATTQASSDSTAPSKPNGLAASAASSTQINLSWTASTDNVGVTGYRIYRDGTQIGTSATTTYQNTGLSPSTAYSYTVAAYDAAGNVSAQSTAASANTPSGSTAPTTSATECTDWQTLHPEWIFCDDFEDGTALVRQGRYFEHDNNSGEFIIATGVGAGGSKAMRALWQQGEVNAGSIKLGFGRNPSTSMNTGLKATQDFREIYYRMYVKMQAGWEGNPAKLSRAMVISASDWSQAMIAHIWGDGSNLLVIDPVGCVDSNGKVICTGYNDFSHMTWLGAVSGTSPLFASQNADQWYCVESHVKLNDSGQSNGVQEYWINGQLEASRNDLNFVGSYSAYGINAIFFENYWNSGSPKQQERYFDNIVVSTQRIGCTDSNNMLLAPTGLRLLN